MSTNLPKLRIENIPLGKVKKSQKNARVHSDQQIEALRKSIEKFGFNVPIIIDQKSKILAGHARYTVAKALGMETIPAVRISHLTNSQKRAYMLADNRIPLDAEWDMEILRGEILDIGDDSDLLESIGFTDEELSGISEGFDFDDEDEGESDNYNEVPKDTGTKDHGVGDAPPLKTDAAISGLSPEERPLRLLLCFDSVDDKVGLGKMLFDLGLVKSEVVEGTEAIVIHGAE